MIFCIAVGLIGLILVWRHTLAAFGPDWGMAAILGLFSALIGVMFGAVLSLFVGTFLPKERTIVLSYELAAMQSNTGMEGSFFLIGGSFGTSWTYRYYQKEGEFLRPKELTIDQTNVLVKQENDGNPRLEVSGQRFITGWHKWIGLIEGDHMYLFVVPEGSVVQEFKL